MIPVLWITSYVILSFTVLGLGLAVAALYRMIVKSQHLLKIGVTWPLPGIYVGSTFSLMGAYHPERKTHPLRDTVLCVLPVDGVDCTPHLVSAAILAKELGVSSGILLPHGELATPDWFTAIEKSFRGKRLWLAEGKTLALTPEVPVTVLVVNGKLIDACVDLISPAMVRAQFHSAICPMARRVEWEHQATERYQGKPQQDDYQKEQMNA